VISFEMDGITYRCFDHLFAVSRCGKVLRKMAFYEPTMHNCGYLALGRRRLMHRVVAFCWLDRPEGATHVHHKNEIKTDNRADNLEWVTPKQHFTERHTGMGHHVPSDYARALSRARRLGTKDDEKTRQRKAQILADVGPKTPCKFQGVGYPSVAAGARAAGIPPATFRLRCLSKNFPEYAL
jgi:hypothetical protein